MRHQTSDIKKSDIIKQWLAIYTQPRWEKKVHKLLEEAGIESYCPLNTVYRQWSDRIKKVEEPLFKSYVFVRVSKDEQTKVRMTPGVLNFVYWLGKPAVVRDEEIDNIRKFMNEYDEVEVKPIEKIEPGSKLIISGGIMMGEEATALQVFKNTVEVRIESIGFTLVAKLDKSKLELKKGK
jgi:transcription antitermination factor NusG